MLFKDPRITTVTDFVFQQLQDAIYRGEIKIGEQLAPVDDIAQAMKVCGESVEEAVALLIENGYVEDCGDAGYIVRLPASQHQQVPFPHFRLPRESSLDELLEARIGLESFGVALAVDRADERDIEFMRGAISGLSEGGMSMKKNRDADIKFHMGIAFATHNSVYIEMLRRLYDTMYNSISKLHSLLYEDQSNVDIIEQHHFKILDAISHRDKEGAKRHMIQHIVFLRSFLRRVDS